MSREPLCLTVVYILKALNIEKTSSNKNVLLMGIQNKNILLGSPKCLKRIFQHVPFRDTSMRAMSVVTFVFSKGLLCADIVVA